MCRLLVLTRCHRLQQCTLRTKPILLTFASANTLVHQSKYLHIFACHVNDLLVQDAAGYFKLLHDVVAPQLDDVPSFDISIDSTEMLELLMLAQAQESFLQKATRDKKNPAVLARCEKYRQ